MLLRFQHSGLLAAVTALCALLDTSDRSGSQKRNMADLGYGSSILPSCS